MLAFGERLEDGFDMLADDDLPEGEFDWDGFREYDPSDPDEPDPGALEDPDWEYSDILFGI